MVCLEIPVILLNLSDLLNFPIPLLMLHLSNIHAIVKREPDKNRA